MKQGGTYINILVVVSLGIATFLIFQNLSSPAIRIWDEAIYADNALDMYSFGDPIVMHRNGEPTLYNTKPPFVIWMQTLSMRVFGVNEFAIRFPSALAGVLTCVILLLFSSKALGDLRIGVIAVCVLATSKGYIGHHVVKTGDLDAVLVFWTTFYTLLFVYFLIRKPKNYRSLISWVAVGIIGAFLSKSVAGLIPVSGLAVCAFAANKGIWVMRQWYTWLVTGIVLMSCMGFYVIREFVLPGYLYHVHYSEYTRFTVNILPWHNHPWYYYFWNWQRLEFFTPYVYWLPVAVLFGLFSVNLRKTTMLFAVQVLAFIGVLSYPIVKLMWYDAPVYPLLALLCAIGLIVVWDWFVRRTNMPAQMTQITFTVVLIILFAFPIKEMYKKNADLYLPVDILEREGFSVRQLHRETPELKQYKILMPVVTNAHYTQIDFYVNAYNRYKDYNLEILKDTSDVHTGQTILCCQEAQIQWLEANFETEQLFRNEIGCVLMYLRE